MPSISSAKCWASAPSLRKCCDSEPTTTTTGSTLTSGSARFPWSGPRRAYARRTTSALGSTAWSATTSMASTSSSRAWSRARPFAPSCPSFPATIPTIASCTSNAAASRTTTFTYAMKFSAPWSYESHPFSPSTPLTTSMVILLWRKNFSAKGSPFVRTTMPSWPSPIPRRCRQPRIA